MKSTITAGYAGRYRIAYQRWPTVSELEEFMCMPGHADRFDMQPMSCDEVVALPRMELTPRGADLEMKFFRSANEPGCRLLVRAPPADAHATAFPTVRIETTVFSCRDSS